jgi:glycosyltransferase involved in cell wall biosynthesis
LRESLQAAGIDMVGCQVELSRQSPQLWAQHLQQLITRHDLHLLHANSLSMSRKLGAVADQLPVPATGHLRDMMRLSSTAIAALNRLQALIAVSDATRQFHLAQGMHPDRLQRIYNGIDARQFAPRPRTGSLLQELKLPEETLLAGIVGQICLRKAHDIFAQAAVRLQTDFPRLHYVIIGERYSTKPESVEFDRQISACFQQAGMPERLHRLGRRHDLPALYPELDLLVHPARQEPLRRVLLEAGACGVPVVATSVGGTPEIFSPEEASLVSPNDPVPLADGIHGILIDLPAARQRARQACSTILQRFSLDTAAQAHRQLWRSVARR